VLGRGGVGEKRDVDVEEGVVCMNVDVRV
jgi:hypothetical protein